MPSIMRQKPGPEVAVALRVPASAAPFAIVIAVISSSVCTTTTEFPFSFRNDASWASGASLPPPVVVREPGAVHVHLRDALLRAEHVLHGLRDLLEIILEQAERGGHRQDVDHAAELAALVGVDLPVRG